MSFVAERISSVEELEVLLLLRAHRDRSWTPGEVSTHRRSTKDSAARRLGELHSRGLVALVGETNAPAYGYCPESELLEQRIDRLAEAYAERPHAVIRLIFSRKPPT